MRAVLAVALALAAAPASAHCYSVWKYPWKQNCGMQMASRIPVREDRRLDPPLPPDPPLVRLDFAPATIRPPPEEWTEDALRAFAIQKLREKMERK